MGRSLDEWTSSLFIIAIAVLIVAGMGWEIFGRHGEDPYILGFLTFLTVIPLAGRAAVRIIKAARSD